MGWLPVFLDNHTEVAHCWAPTTHQWPALVQHWPSIGPALVQHWSSIGPALAQHWSSIGPALVQHWSSIGSALVQHWPSIGPALAQPWPRIGPALVQQWTATVCYRGNFLLMTWIAWYCFWRVKRHRACCLRSLSFSPSLFFSFYLVNDWMFNLFAAVYLLPTELLILP